MYAKNNFFTSMAGAGEGNSKCAGKFISIIFWKDVKGSDSLHPPPPPPPPPSIPYQLHSSKDFRLLVVVSKEHLINFDEKSVKKDFSNTTAKHKHVLQVHPNQLIILVKLATLYIIVQLCFSMV